MPLTPGDRGCLFGVPRKSRGLSPSLGLLVMFCGCRLGVEMTAQITPSLAFTPPIQLQQLWILWEPELRPLPWGSRGPQWTPHHPRGLLLVFQRHGQ